MNDIIVKFKEILNTKMDLFFEKASKKLCVNKNVLISIWNETILPTEEKNSNIKSKKSFYQIFFSIKRIELKKNNPSLNFGELSKQISKLWNQMNKEEQNEWIKNNVQGEDVSFPDKSYKNMKITELKNLCIQKGLNIKGNKNDLIMLLTNETHPPDDSLHLTENVNDEKRIQIELKDDHDEEDFIFDDDEEDDNSNQEEDVEEYEEYIEDEI